MNKIINLTPHSIVILSNTTPVTFSEGDKFKATPLANASEVVVDREIPSAGAARVTKKVTDQDAIDGIPTEGAVFGEIIDLPELSDGVYFIVSALVAAAAVAQGRRTSDLLTPGTTVRDAENPSRVLGTMKLQRN